MNNTNMQEWTEAISQLRKVLKRPYKHLVDSLLEDGMTKTEIAERSKISRPALNNAVKDIK